MSFDRALLNPNHLRDSWGWVLALGIGMVIAGTVSISVPAITEIGIVTLLGIVMLLAGVAQLVGAFYCHGWQGVLLQLLVAVLYLVTGFMILENKLEAVAGLTLLLAAFFLASGVIRIIVALRERFHAWGWVLLSGAVNVLLGLIIWRQFPESALWVIGLLIGIDLIFAGWTWIMLAFLFRKLPEQTSGNAA